LKSQNVVTCSFPLIEEMACSGYQKERLALLLDKPALNYVLPKGKGIRTEKLTHL
jgi:hypothetical protein